MADDIFGEIYKEMGAKPIINAIGSVTLLGGSTPKPVVKEAMDRADAAYVNLPHLQEVVGKKIADYCNVPSAYVTSGAGAALALAGAAFMAGNDDDLIQQLPNTSGMKGEMLIQKCQRYWYDRCIEVSGAKLVEFGDELGAVESDLENAITEQTCGITWVANELSPGTVVGNNIQTNPLSLEKVIEIAKKHGIYVLVDAAAQIYPLDILGKYIRMGADAQVIAAKYMGASQSVGLALGTEEMIGKIANQSFTGYEGRRIRGIGRPMKVDRQEIIGVTVAVNEWVTMNHEERLAEAEQQSNVMLAPLQNIKGVKAEIINNIIGNQPFGVRLEIDENIVGISAAELVQKLQDLDTPIWTRNGQNHEENMIKLVPWALSPGQDKIVGEAIAKVLQS
ncbi:MAG: hypothetical protein FI681_01900 [SAR202 cluster bacterium]|jgi:L-seryl-tRNA(Ser) seleniumtransferase|nr:hypothetical protein [SAR202 cluster bacterium]